MYLGGNNEVNFIISHLDNKLIINIKDGESIERAIRRYKRKHRDVKLHRELRERKHFTKKSVRRRNERLDAEYRLRKFGE